MRRHTTFSDFLVLPLGAAADDSAPDLTATIGSGFAFLARGSLGFKETRECAECHHAPFTIRALKEGKRRGYAVDETALAVLTAGGASKDIPTKTPPKPGPVGVNEAPLRLGPDGRPDRARPEAEAIVSVLSPGRPIPCPGLVRSRAGK
jgi:hypothetical protein